jgi:hypothetical protein
VCLQVQCAELEVIRVWTLHRIYKTFASSSSSSSVAVRPPRRVSGRRRRLRDPTTAAHVGVCGGGGSAPPPLQWASVAAVPPTKAARLCRRGPSLATARPSGWLTDAQWHHRHILQNIKHPCNPIPVYCCISIAILQPGGAHNFMGKVYTRYIPGIEWHFYDRYIPGIYQKSFLVYTWYIPVI